MTENAPKNVYQRKLAVIARCKEITLDKTHPHHKFEYVSIQNLENRLREFIVEAGIDVSGGFPPEQPGYYRLTLTNADDPGDQLTEFWPVVEDDKGYAFTVKYPLMRTFHVGDGEEADEAEGASRSGRAATEHAGRRRQPAGATGPQNGRSVAAATPAPVEEIPGTDRPFRERDLCPACALDGNKTTRGGRPAFFIPKQGPHAGVLQCNGRAYSGQGAWLNHIPAISPQEAATADDNPANEAEIPA